jgi:Fe2+ or Zn2+ uptake regulation protein
MFDVKLIEEKLKACGYKLTNQRKAIIEVLVEHKGQFISAEEIYIKSREKHPDTNFSTIYRNLSIFENTGIIHNTRIDGDASVYEIMDMDSHHHHIICKGCGKTEAIDFCPMTGMAAGIRTKNFTLTDHKFELYGYCKDCEKNLSKKKYHTQLEIQ